MIRAVAENVLVTFCYPGSSLYLNNFIKTINSQKYKNFRIIFFCNNFFLKKNFLKNLKNLSESHNITGSPSTVRQKALKYLLKLKVKKICFADLDDHMESNRVGVVFNLLDHHDIVFNDISLFYRWKKTF